MRRSLATAVVALSLSLVCPLSPPSTAATAEGNPGRTDQRQGAGAPPAVVLDRAAEAVAGEQPSPSGPVVESPTLALRDLFVALPRLQPADRAQARRLLARPTDGVDPQGDEYSVPSRRTCSRRICVHWVPRTADAPPGRGWVTTTMRVMKRTWAAEVGRLDYRRPLTDGGRGGDKRFDVYLADVGADGYYGYCVPERRLVGWRWRASGYCVLDDDFARSQFGAKPLHSLKVTAAHEFFHAVQFGYDYAEDRWLMEGSATWMEERVADGVNDNRQYLRYGQVARPGSPLDRYVPSGFDQYGNWAFFEFLSTRFGNSLVRTVWETAADVKDADTDPYSTLAVRRSLPGSLSFPEVYRAYAAANTTVDRSYPEGESWPSAAPAVRHTLSTSARRRAGSLRIDHLAARTVSVRRDADLGSGTRTLRLVVDGPPRRTGPTAMAVVHRTDGSVERVPVALDPDGRGQRTVAFGPAVARVTLTLANASTRFRCWQQDETYSCQGQPRDDNRSYDYRVRAPRS